jgi:pyruvate kinase
MTILSLDVSRAALRRRRTKIVATVGPASAEPAMLRALIDAGVDVFRLNFSHGTHELHAAAYARIRGAAESAGKHVAILADLCGPKIRVGKFAAGAIELQLGSKVVVTTREVEGTDGLIPSEYRALAQDVETGSRILLDDGKLELRVLEVQGTEITCTVINGGKLSNRKGMNLPGVNVSAPALTEKDRIDAVFAAKLEVDYLALSFVRAAADVRELKALLKEIGVDTPVIVKIEKPEALAVIGEILEASDGVMVARGDLGVEMPPEEVPLIQQELVRLTRQVHKPVIIATQMLESMIEEPRPTRAEVTDVAWAAMAQADAVMLSAETAAGKYPREAVSTMDRVLRLIEGYQWKHGHHGRPGSHARVEHAELDRHTGALSRATSLLSREVEVHAVVVPTRTGRTARVVSSERPAAPIVAVTSSRRLCQRFALLWGVAPELASEEELQSPAHLAKELARKLELGKSSEEILMVWDSSRDRTASCPSVSILTL